MKRKCRIILIMVCEAKVYLYVCTYNHLFHNYDIQLFMIYLMFKPPVWSHIQKNKYTSKTFKCNRQNSLIPRYNLNTCIIVVEAMLGYWKLRDHSVRDSEKVLRDKHKGNYEFEKIVKCVF